MHKTTIPEDQVKFAITLNRDTEKLYYNQRLIVDNNVLTEPRAWQISKINRIMPGGIAIITLAQTKFDGDKDYVEIDKTTEEVIGLWADYFVGNTEATDPVETDSIHAEITYSGQPTMRVGSGYKKFAVIFYKDGSEFELIEGQWQYFIGDEDVSSLIIYSTTEVNPNEVKIKFNSKDQTYGGKILTIKYITNNNIEASIDINLANL